MRLILTLCFMVIASFVLSPSCAPTKKYGSQKPMYKTTKPTNRSAPVKNNIKTKYKPRKGESSVRLN